MLFSLSSRLVVLSPFFAKANDKAQTKKQFGPTKTRSGVRFRIFLQNKIFFDCVPARVETSCLPEMDRRKAEADTYDFFKLFSEKDFSKEHFLCALGFSEDLETGPFPCIVLIADDKFLILKIYFQKVSFENFTSKKVEF